jgi:hypothetical protein
MARDYNPTRTFVKEVLHSVWKLEHDYQWSSVPTSFNPRELQNYPSSTSAKNSSNVGFPTLGCERWDSDLTRALKADGQPFGGEFPSP